MEADAIYTLAVVEFLGYLGRNLAASPRWR